jgi:DNA-binding FadR family transcriptional regulator
MKREGRQAQCTEELQQIVDAIRQHKPEEARSAAQRHIVASCLTAKEALGHPFTPHDRVA